MSKVENYLILYFICSYRNIDIYTGKIIDQHIFILVNFVTVTSHSVAGNQHYHLESSECWIPLARIQWEKLHPLHKVFGSD